MRTANLSSLLETLEALEGTGTGAWGWDVATNTIRWSRNSGALYGLEPGYEPASYEDFLALVHPADRAAVAAAVSDALERAQDYEIDFRAPWPDSTMHWLSARGHAITGDDNATLRIVGIVSDITERKRMTEQHRFLAEAGELLAASLEVEATLAHVSQLLVAELADWCSVQMVEKGKLRTSVVAHRDPEMMALVDRLQTDYPPSPEPAGVARAVLETGQPVVIDEIPDELLVEAAVDDNHLEILRSLGLCSALTVPISVRGTILALMTLVSAESGRRFTPADVTFAEEFARHAAMALDNARLHQESVRARNRAERSSTQLQAVHNVVIKLSQASDVASVAHAAVDEGVTALGADRGAVVLRSDDGPAMVASVGYSPERLAAFGPSLGQPGPLAEAMTRGTTVFCGNLHELVERYPNLRPIMENVDEGAFSSAPLRTPDGLIGAIGFVYERSRAFTKEDRTLITSLAQHVALAIERSMLFERIRSVAEALQAALAPPALAGEGRIPAAARYRAAGVGAIGGDWYDVVDSPRGSQIFVIGDVVGRGLEAVATMAQLRHSLRMLLLEGHKPSDALATLSSVASVDTSALCSTVLCAEVEAGSDQVRLTSAGHLPPVIVGAGAARLVDLPVGPPLGVPGGAPDHTVAIADGECIVLYTDGLIERRDRHIDDSLEHLCSMLGGMGHCVDDIADALLARAFDAEDDATILVIGGSASRTVDGVEDSAAQTLTP